MKTCRTKPLRHLVLPHLDLLLQRAPALVAHHHVHRLVGAEEIQHAHDVRMVDLGERPALLEEALHAVAERRQVLGRARADDVALGAQHERRRQVFLDGDRRAVLVEGAVDDREAAAADLPVDPVVQQLVAADERLVGDGHGRSSGEVEWGRNRHGTSDRPTHRNSHASERFGGLRGGRITAYILGQPSGQSKGIAYASRPFDCDCAVERRETSQNPSCTNPARPQSRRRRPAGSLR